MDDLMETAAEEQVEGRGERLIRRRTARKRKVFYSPEFAERAERLARMGAYDSEIAAQLGVADMRTLAGWKNRYPEFRAALERGQLEADMQVVAALFRRATGGTCRDVKIIAHKGQPVVVPYEKEVLPDVNACIFWLRNRRPELWRENAGPSAESHPDIPETLTPEQEDTLRRIARIRAEGEAMAFGGNRGEATEPP